MADPSWWYFLGGAYTICWPVLGSITVARFTRLGVRSRGPWDSESERVAFGGWDASRCRRARSSVDRHAGCRAMIAAAVAALQLRADAALTPECQKWLAYSWAALRVDIAPRIFELSSVVHKPAAVAWPIAPSLREHHQGGDDRPQSSRASCSRSEVRSTCCLG